MTILYYEKNEKITNKKYVCEKCIFVSCKKTDYNRHINTKKHIKLHNTTNIVEKYDKEYKCGCGKTYKHHSSLYNHKKTCNKTDINNSFKENILLENIDEKDNIDYKTMFLELINENKEFINKALKSVESKQLKNLNVWLETHPNYMNNPSEQLMSECGKSVDEGKDKIIKKLCDNVYIEKVHE
jgi:hypothetical protein